MLTCPARGTKAFTLLELIVVIVILGILAALAIPTFARVTKRAQDATTAATVASVLRDARALVAFGDGTTWAQAVDIAVKETNAPVAAGLSAAALSAARAGTTVNGTTVTEPSLSLAVYAASADVAVLSLKSGSGNVCIGAATVSSSTTPTCLPALSSGSSASAVLEGRALSDGAVVPLPAGATPGVTTPTPTSPGLLAPAAPTGVSASAGVSSARVSWTAASGGGAPASYVVTPSSGSAVIVLPSGGVLATSAEVTGLTAGAPVTFTVTATNTQGSVVSAASSPVTPTAPVALALRDGAAGFFAFEETSGTAARNGAGSVDGTFPSGTTLGLAGPSSSSKAIRLNGSGGVTVPSSSSSALTKPFTLETWVRPSAAQTSKYLLSADSGANDWAIIYGYAAGKVEFFSGAYSGANPRTGTAMDITVNSWNHVVYTYDGATLKGYVNGTERVSVTTNFTLAPQGGTVHIGSATGNLNAFVGDVAPPAWYKSALTREQVQEHFSKVI